jgi:hypothetical protein
VTVIRGWPQKTANGKIALHSVLLETARPAFLLIVVMVG